MRRGPFLVRQNRPAPASDDGVSFGPFRLYPGQKLLLEGDKPVRLGSRALDLLIALVEARGGLVGKDDLVRQVWPDTFVEEGNLRVHLAVLRKALGDGRDGARYIVNVPGRGYQFVAPVGPVAPAAGPGDRDDRIICPPRFSTSSGATRPSTNVAVQLRERRFVTIVGPGGIGKTTVALAVAETAGGGYRDGARFVDLSLVTDPRLVPGALASALGLAITLPEPAARPRRRLAGKDMLVVLDNCEHVIEAAAGLAEAIVQGAAGVHLLATSREPLRAAGERILRLGPLDLPPTSAGLTASEAMRLRGGAALRRARRCERRRVSTSTMPTRRWSSTSAGGSTASRSPSSSPPAASASSACAASPNISTTVSAC